MMSKLLPIDKLPIDVESGFQIVSLYIYMYILYYLYVCVYIIFYLCVDDILNSIFF